MTITIFIAGTLSLLAFLIHAIIGDKENQALNPGTECSPKQQESWLQIRCGWHWVSVDLLLCGILLIAIALDYFAEARLTLLSLLSIYFFSTGIVWLVTVFLTKNNHKQLLILGQWMLCFVIAGLVYIGR